MSNAQFAEATSADPYVQNLHRRAVRVLNDQSLDREHRVRLIRQLQQSLLSHQTSETNKAQKMAAKKKAKGCRLYDDKGEPVAVPSQVTARRREMGECQHQQVAEKVEPKRLLVVATKGSEAIRRRPILSLTRD